MSWLVKRNSSVTDLFAAKEGDSKTILGWVASKRVVGGLAFLLIRDGTGYAQAALKKGTSDAELFDKVAQVPLESAVLLAGRIRLDRRAPGGKEVAIEKFEVVARADKWPITKSAARSASFLYDSRHLSLRGRKAIATMKIRAELIYAAFDFFTRRGFMLVSAPSLVQNAVEGGATLFQLDYFGKPAYLSQSAQLYEEAAICAFEKVFIFQPAFRAEKSKTPKHLTEFWMIEAEQAYATQADNMRLQEDLVAFMCQRIEEKRKAELDILGRKFKVPSAPFPKVSYDKVREIAEQKGIKYSWGEDIPTEAEKLVSQNYETPFFITDYPLSARSFYHMTRSGDDRITLSADLFAPEGYGEIATGGQRIHDHSKLEERISKQEIPPESFKWYLDLRKYGLPPHSGFGLGVERTVRWISGLKHIRAASLFPRTITRIAP